MTDVKMLIRQVGELIKQAHAQWDELHVDDNPPPARMLPLIRLRVRFTSCYTFEKQILQRSGCRFIHKMSELLMGTVFGGF